MTPGINPWLPAMSEAEATARALDMTYAAMRKPRPPVYVGGRYMLSLPLFEEEGEQFGQYVPFEVWNARSHFGHQTASHYLDNQRVGYTCRTCMWLCPIYPYDVSRISECCSKPPLDGEIDQDGIARCGRCHEWAKFEEVTE